MRKSLSKIFMAAVTIMVLGSVCLGFARCIRPSIVVKDGRVHPGEKYQPRRAQITRGRHAHDKFHGRRPDRLV